VGFSGDTGQAYAPATVGASQLMRLHHEPGQQ